jgi:hypothetical protein
VAVFGFSERKSGKQNRKKKASCLKNWNCKLELQTESEFYDGRRFGRKLVELVGCSAEQKVKEQNNKASHKQVIT